MSKFAEGTTVSLAKSRAEIETLITRYGATHFVAGWKPYGAVIAFQMNERHVRFDLPLPDENEKRFHYMKRMRRDNLNTPAQRKALCEAEHRRRWRSLALVIKAKLEAVDSGVTTFEAEFLAHLVVPGGKTFAEIAIPQIAEAYARGEAMPPLLGGGT